MHHKVVVIPQNPIEVNSALDINESLIEVEVLPVSNDINLELLTEQDLIIAPEPSKPIDNLILEKNVITESLTNNCDSSQALNQVNNVQASDENMNFCTPITVCSVVEKTNNTHEQEENKENNNLTSNQGTYFCT